MSISPTRVLAVAAVAALLAGPAASQSYLPQSRMIGGRERLTRWLVECQTGLSRLRAGLPAGWRAGDKTGTGENGACSTTSRSPGPKEPRGRR